MKHDKQAIKDLANYCRPLYCGNIDGEETIKEFELTYQPDQAIWWYTRECFTYQMLNRALRTLDAEVIINMGFFIHDLCKQIQQLHHQQVSSYKGKPFIVYRGQRLSKADFEKFSKTTGGLLSFNNFLSTSQKREKSLEFIPLGLDDPDKMSILFVITVDPNIFTTPFASVGDLGYFKDEAEILFSMHSVFRIGTVKQRADKNNLYCEVQLQLTADDDPQLRVLTKRMESEVQGGTGWERLGRILFKIRQLDKAEELYTMLLEQTCDKSDRAHYYHQLGNLKHNQVDYKMAIEYYEKALEIREKSLPSNHPKLATSYSSIGLVYRSMGEYSSALSFLEKALEIYQKTLPSNHPDLATLYHSIGSVYRSVGEYSKALTYFERALNIRQHALPANHPHIKTVKENIESCRQIMKK
ncbi:unnamed protein product [Adineta ricciae]|nr:unnamed protein product [Adineta ricciae]